MTDYKPHDRDKAASEKFDFSAFRRPLIAFILLFIISLTARALLQDGPLTWHSVFWAAALAFGMTVIQEFFKRRAK